MKKTLLTFLATVILLTICFSSIACSQTTIETSISDEHLLTANLTTEMTEAVGDLSPPDMIQKSLNKESKQKTVARGGIIPIEKAGFSETTYHQRE